MDMKISHGTAYINGKKVNFENDEIDFENNNEHRNDDLFYNTDGDLFYKTLKIANIRKLNTFEIILNKIKQLLY